MKATLLTLALIGCVIAGTIGIIFRPLPGPAGLPGGPAATGKADPGGKGTAKQVHYRRWFDGP